jgi:hypothetical protein
MPARTSHRISEAVPSPLQASPLRPRRRHRDPEPVARHGGVPRRPAAARRVRRRCGPSQCVRCSARAGPACARSGPRSHPEEVFTRRTNTPIPRGYSPLPAVLVTTSEPIRRRTNRSAPSAFTRSPDRYNSGLTRAIMAVRQPRHRGARADTATPGDQRHGSRAHLAACTVASPATLSPTRHADRTDLSWRDTQLIRRQRAHMRVERTNQRGRRIVVNGRQTTLTSQHRHIRSSSLFKHAHHRMIVDGFRVAATVNIR